MRSVLSLVLLILAAFAPLPAAAVKGVSDPVKMVAAAYLPYRQNRNDAVIDLPQTSRLDGILSKSNCCDSDFFVDGQDYRLSHFSVKARDQTKTRMTVVARFINLGTPVEIDFYFVKSRAGWLLDDALSIADGRRTLYSSFLQNQDNDACPESSRDCLKP